jgi:hypothetical protein
VLLVCNGGALYYIVSKAAVRGFGWQVSFLKIALFEWFSEVVLLRGVEIALFDYGLCWLVEGEVEAAMAHVAAAAASFSAVGVGVDAAVSSVSQEMAQQWPGLSESRWVAGLFSQQPFAAVHGDRRGCRRWWTRLLSRGSLGTWEMAVSFGCPLVLVWLVFMYYRFVDGWLTSLSALGQGLAAVTVLVSAGLCVLAVVYWRRSRRTKPPGPSTAAVEAGDHSVDVANNLRDSQVPPLVSIATDGRPPPDGQPSRNDPSSASPSPSPSLSSASLGLSQSFGSIVSSSDCYSEAESSWHFSDDSDIDQSSSGSSCGSAADSFVLSISISDTTTPRESSVASSADHHRRDGDSDDGSGYTVSLSSRLPSLLPSQSPWPSSASGVVHGREENVS